MNILFVTSQIPYPPTNGVRIVSYHAMRLMREAGHNISLAILSEETWDIESRLEHLRKMCSHTEHIHLQPKRKGFLALKTLLGRLYFIERYSDRTFRKCLKQTINLCQPDSIHLDTILMAQYYDVPPPGIRIIASINDSYSLSLENKIAVGGYKGFHLLYRSLQLLVSRRYEKTIYPFFDATHVMSSIDADYLHKLNKKIITAVIPNGASEKLLNLPLPDFHQYRLVFVANWGEGNLFNLKQFLLESWIIVRQHCPDAILSVVGHFPKEGGSIIKLAEKIGNVRFSGYVENIQDVYSNSCIAVVPIQKNCGIINKVLEGMAAAHCVIGLTQAFSGLALAREGVHYSSSNDFSSLAEKITQFLSDPCAMKRIGEESRNFIRDNYAWDSKLKSYEALYSGNNNTFWC